VAGDALNRVAAAADKVARLEPRLEEARRELHAAIIDARKDGATVVVIAKVAGLSRQRVQQILARSAS